MKRFRQAVREALMITLAATVLGIVYSASTGTGFFTSAPRKAAQDSPQRDAAPAMISSDEARTLFESGKALFVDARHEFDYKLGHIEGAINIPLNEFETRKTNLTSVPVDRAIVAYCDGVDCNSSIELAARLYAQGFMNVKIFFGGWKEWNALQLPTEASPQ